LVKERQTWTNSLGSVTVTTGNVTWDTNLPAQLRMSNLLTMWWLTSKDSAVWTVTHMGVHPQSDSYTQSNL